MLVWSRITCYQPNPHVMLRISLLSLLFLLYLSIYSIYAQGSDEYGAGIKLKVNEDGSKYIRFITWHQIWTRYTQNNPGTADVNGNLKETSADIGIRRSRFLAYTQISKKFLILTHWGINNQTFVNGGVPGGGATGNSGGVVPDAVSSKKPQIFIHDAWTEYTVVDPKNADGEARGYSIYMGAGLHYWHGISRKTNASTLNFMTIDAPIFNWPNIELTDQFARQFGWYAKGKIGKLEYRLNANKPFSVGSLASTNTSRAVNVPTDNMSYSGYAEYQFLDVEADVLPYKVGSWLGTKKVFNVGLGFYNHANASAIRRTTFLGNDSIDFQNQTIFSADAFLDLPVGPNKSSLTLYGVYYNFDYGTKYLRNVGIMNVNTSTLAPAVLQDRGIQTVAEGAGNARMLMGTGNIIYVEAGYLLPKNILPEDKGRIQPMGSFTVKQFQAVDESALFYDLGVNYLIDGHHAKLTLQYSSRPLFRANAEGKLVNATRAGELILQAHIYL